jgi:RNA polymerase-binding transcription factor DksA
VVRSAKPAAKSAKPAAKSAKPAAKSAKPAAKSAKPAPTELTAEQPATGFTEAELGAIRSELDADIVRMQAEYEQSLANLDELQQAGTDGAGDDQADAGSNTFDREQELSIVANRLDLLSQMLHAVERLEQGTYGFCEVCGNPIPRLRLQAFPMATLDVSCKQREERR